MNGPITHVIRRSLSLNTTGFRLAGLLLLCAAIQSVAQAATGIAPTTGAGDLGTLVLPPNGHVYGITGGTPVGTNLYHSFAQFNVGTGDIAQFQTLTLSQDTAMLNILGRITDANPSTIFGAIDSATYYPSANLFLMNPYGFLFGPTAMVNVGGMAAFTTADYLKLTDNVRFEAVPGAQDALLSTASVAAFGFLGSNPGAITIQGSQFSVTDGQSISLVGGNIAVRSGTLDDGITVQPAQLSAPGGQINLASVASPGEVSAVDFVPASGMTLGTINLSQGATLDVSSNAAGTVRIRSGQLVMDNATISANTVNADGALISVDINVTGGVSISDTRGVPVITSRTTGLGNAGEVQITSGNLNATSSAQSVFTPVDTHFALIDTHTSGSGTAGNVSIETTGNVNVAGQPTGPLLFIDSGTVGFDGGHGGDVTLTGKNIQFSSTRISTGDFVAQQASPFESAGSGGNVTITADTLTMSLSLITTDGFWAGRAGDLTLNARNIDLNTGSGLSLLEFEGGGKLTINADRLTADFSQIDSETVLGPGGGITITANVVELKNGTTLRSQTQGDGNAGDIRITATDHLTLADRFTTDPNDPTTVGARARPTGLFTNALGESGFGDLGNAGSIIVTTPRLEITDGARINSTTQSSGLGGDVVITAPTLVTISGERPTEVIEEGLFGVGSTRASGIYSRTVGNEFCSGTCGDAGHVSITTESLSLSSGAVLNSGTINAGRGGGITVHSTDTVSISGTMADGTPGGIFSRTVGIEPDSGNGGLIELHAGQFELTSGAQISASSLGAGNAGNVNLHGPTGSAQSVLIDGAGSGISTDTQGTGAGGNILVNANSVTLQNGGALSAKTSGLEVTATGGTITVEGNTLQLNSGGMITAQSTGSGNAGNVTIQGHAGPSDSLVISGFDENFNLSGIFTDTQATGAGGNIHISARAISLQNSGILSATTSGTTPTATGGTITIDAETLSIDSATITAETRADNTGRAGDVTISAKTIDTANFSFITTLSNGIGQAGDISLIATDRITLIDSFVNSDAASFSTTPAGNGGFIHLHAPMIDLQSTLLGTTTLGAGNAGNVLLEAQQLSIRASDFGRTITTGSILATQTQGSGNAGTVTIRGIEPKGSSAKVVTITDASQLSSRTSGSGNAGNISIAAAQLTLTNDANLSSSTLDGTGTGGSINLFTDSFTMQNGSTLSAKTTGAGDAGNVTVQGLASPAQSVLIDGPGSGVFTDTQGTGAGGSIFVNANSVTLQNGGTLSAKTSGTEPTATGGTITMDAANTVTMNSASIKASSTGTADAGSIDLTAMNGFTMQNSTITTQAGKGAGGGNITITTAPSATVLLEHSRINASVADGPGGGGNISIDPQFVILQNSQILAQAAQGQGGAITIIANLFLSDANSIVNADSGSGVNGTITIQSPNAPVSGQIQPLNKTPLLATSLLDQRCAALAGGQFSSFTVAGRDILPTEPGSWLASPLATLDPGMGPRLNAEGERLEGMSASAGQVASGQWRVGDTPILSLRQIAPAGFLTQTFAVDRSAACTS